MSLFYVVFSGESEGSCIFDGGMDPLFRTIPEQNIKITRKCFEFTKLFKILSVCIGRVSFEKLQVAAWTSVQTRDASTVCVQ